MRKPLNTPIRKPKSRERNIHLRLSIHVPKNTIPQLRRHMPITPLPHPPPHIRKPIEESRRLGRQPRRHPLPYRFRQEARILRRGRAFERIVEAVAGPQQEFFEVRGGDYGGDADVAEEVPGGGDQGGEVVEGEKVEDVEHYFGGELIDGEGVEALEGEAGLEAEFNLCGVWGCWGGDGGWWCC